MRGEKRGNEYLGAVTIYSSTPKAVWAAIAISYASAGGDNLSSVVEERILQEWTALWYSGIVPQKPPRLVEASI